MSSMAHVYSGTNGSAQTLKFWVKTANVSSVRAHKKGISIKVASPPEPGEKIIYALHGGQSAHPNDPTAAIARGLLRHVEKSVTRVFSLEYRLAVGKPLEPAHPFPTQLLDALAGYNYLISTRLLLKQSQYTKDYS